MMGGICYGCWLRCLVLRRAAVDFLLFCVGFVCVSNAKMS